MKNRFGSQRGRARLIGLYIFVFGGPKFGNEARSSAINAPSTFSS